MAFTYYTTLSADRDIIRLQTGDTQENAGPRPDKRNFADEEITFILADEGHRVAAVAAIFEILANEWAAWSISEREGDASIDAKEVSDRYSELAAEWRAKPNGSGTGSSSITVGMIALDIQQTDTTND